MNTYTEPEFLAVAETLGYRRVNQSSRMGGTALAATDGGVVFVRDWEKCATPDDVERLLACYHSLERKNRAAVALGRMGGASTSPAMRAAGSRAADARRVAEAAERELAHANPFQADAAAWTNERALQEAQTEKEAHA